jgi:cytochrome c
MKKLLVILICSSLAFACNSSSNSAATEKKDTASSAPASSTTSSISPAGEKGLELIGSSDCTTCHRLEKAAAGSAIGPAYSEVAAKYAPAADSTVDRLVNKIIKGGTGVWGTTPMTPHPALSPADVKTMVTYILSLKK